MATCPSQGNSYDCGVWVCINAFYAASKCVRWPMTAAHVPAARKLIAHMIVNWDRAVLKFRCFFFCFVVLFFACVSCAIYISFISFQIAVFA